MPAVSASALIGLAPYETPIARSLPLGKELGAAVSVSTTVKEESPVLTVNTCG
jgi:hypothetical protein